MAYTPIIYFAGIPDPDHTYAVEQETNNIVHLKQLHTHADVLSSDAIIVPIQESDIIVKRADVIVSRSLKLVELKHLCKHTQMLASKQIYIAIPQPDKSFQYYKVKYHNVGHFKIVTNARDLKSMVYSIFQAIESKYHNSSDIIPELVMYKITKRRTHKPLVKEIPTVTQQPQSSIIKLHLLKQLTNI